MNLKRLANLFAIALISAATLTACGEDDVIEKDDPTIADDTTDPDKDDPNELPPDEDTDSSEKLKVALLTDYVKDSDTFFFSNGVAINVSQDEETEGYYLFIDSLSFETGEWVEGKDLMAYCDPELRPICVTNAAGDKLFFTYDDNNTFSVTYANANGETKEHTGIQMPEPTQSAKTGTRASTDTDLLDYLPYLSDGLTFLDLGINIVKKDLSGVLNNIDAYTGSKLYEGLGGDILSLGFSELSSKLIKTGALGYAGIILADIQAVQHAIEWRIKIEIGDVTPLITAVEVEGENTVNVSINISNFVANTKSIPLYYVKYWQEVDGKRVGEVHQTGTKEITKEGDIIEPVTNLASGTYAFQVIVYPSSFISDFIIKIYNFRSNVMRTEITNMSLYSIYQNGTAEFLIDINGKHIDTFMSMTFSWSNNALSNYTDYGIYLQTGNETPPLSKLYSIKRLDHPEETEFGEIHTGLLCAIPEEYFDLDFKTFTATAKDIKIGLYTKKGEQVTIHEGVTPKITYTKQPYVRIKNVAMTENRAFEITLDIKGAFWFKEVLAECPGQTYILGTFDEDPYPKTGIVDFDLYDYTQTGCVVVMLKNGTTIRSTNGFKLGTIGSPSISIIN